MNMDILSNLIITKICGATTIHTMQNEKGGYVNRPRWAIIIKYQGETKYICKQKSYVSNINNMIILPKGSTYEWFCVEEGDFCVVEFDCDISCEEIMHFPIKNGMDFVSELKEIEFNNTLRNPFYKVETLRDTYSIILKLIQSASHKYSPGYKYQKISPAVQYIAKNFSKNITNDELAELCGISTVYFRKLFCELYGVSPIAYIRNIRIRKAKEMLKSDYGSITDIASSLGYLNIYDFSRAFKKHSGVSPTKYLSR